MYKLLAIDLDGTLLNSASEIPENNKTAIRKALDMGVHVCLCSGRSFLSLRHFEKALGTDRPGHHGICFNGSMVYQTWNHRVLRDIRLDNTTAMMIVDELLQFGCDVVVYDADRLIAEKETEMIRYYKERSRIPLTLVDSFHSIKGDVSKVLLRGEPDVLAKASLHMAPLIEGRCNQFLTEKYLLEFTNLDANKGTALAFLAAYLGIDLSEVIAVGDHCNDIHMLKEAGLGVAVQNAEEETKQAADYVAEADNNAGAIAEVVEKFL